MLKHRSAFFQRYMQQLRSFLSLTAKRIMDVSLAALGMVLLAPVFLLIAILIKIDSPGPVFYRGQRCGKGCRLFYILKFRTMYEQPQSYNGIKITGQNDARITRMGRWLRQTKLNELPQFWNVFKGEMSLVGPRPEDSDIAMQWPEDVRREVLSVRPGITSPASVLYRNEEALLAGGQVMATYLGDILPSKLRLDQLYVRHRSLLHDLDVLFWTFLVLLPRLGNYAPPENLLFIGPITRLIQRYVGWFTVDTLVTFLAIGAVGTIWRSYGPLNVGLLNSIGVALGFAFLFSLTGSIFGMNRISWSRASMLDAFDLIPALVVATLSAVLINRFLQPLLPEAMVLASAAVASVGLVLARYRSRVISGLLTRALMYHSGVAAAQERVLIVGGGEAAQFVAWWLQNRHRAVAFRIVGCVDDDLYKQGLRIHGMNVLGQCGDIPALVKKHDVGIVIFAIHNIGTDERKRLLDLIASTPAHVMEMPDILADLRATASGNSKVTQSAGERGKMKMLAEIPASQVDRWLAELEELARTGDKTALQDRIRALRHTILG